MTSEADIGAGRRQEALTREELTRRLLALVLAAVLVWYTAVIPSGAHAKGPAAQAPDDEGRDGEVRGRDGAVIKQALTGAAAGRAARESVEDLDWPEYICLE